MLKRYKIPATEFQKILFNFGDAVDNKNFVKIDYPTWKAFKISTAPVEIWLENAQVCIKATKWGTKRFDVTDLSFGQFIYEIYYLYATNPHPWGRYELIPDPQQVFTDSKMYTNSSVEINTNDCVAVATSTSIQRKLDDLTNQLNKYNDTKENDNMKNMINFDFGPCTGSDNIRMSIYGIAVKNANNTFVSYDAASASIMDVDVFNFDGAKFLYKMPVAIKDIKVGDVVIHARKPMFVTDVAVNDKSLKVVDPVSGEKKEIILTRSPFGFDFATKIVNFLGNLNTATADNPFGNIGMLMLMSDDANTDSLLPFLLMNNNNTIDPMVAFALMSNNNNNFLPFYLMSNMNRTSTCACKGECGAHKE